MFNVVEEIRNLIDYLNARTKEYDEGNPTITDAEWDRKYYKLQEYEYANDIFFNDSPTQHISYEVVNSLEKVAHNHDMLSLEKTKTLDTVKDFLGNVPYLAMCKMDGLTCSLKYVNGELVSAETRGNGQVGENILHNARIIPTIPKRIPYAKELVIDGEIICTYQDFEYFSHEYKNPRNFASGSIRLLDANECATRRLKFIAWEVIQGFENERLLSDKLYRLTKCGFTIVPYCHGPVVDANDQPVGLDDMVEHLTEMAKTFGYPIDGLVFKFNNVEYGRSLGKTSHHFKNALAYKFYDEIEFSTLIDIDWTMGRTGVLTPVAVFEPVEMDGSTVERASLHNVSIMQELLGEPYVGQKVSIFKANMIIPQIESAEKRNEPGDIEIPKVCPICGSITSLNTANDTILLTCTNANCEGKLINRLDHFAGKKGLDIKGLSKATLEKLIEWEWVKSFRDLFTLDQYRSEWIKKPGFGIKSVDKLLGSIKDGQKCELNSFISSLGIPLIGSTASKELIKVFSTWESFIDAVESNYKFYDLPNFGYEMHMAISKFDYTEAKFLYDNYLEIAVPGPAAEATEAEKSLDGVTAVITGKLNHFKNRDELKALIEAHGGKVAGSISGKTSYLINNDVNSTSSKNASAKKLGVPIISEDAFIEMFGLS